MRSLFRFLGWPFRLIGWLFRFAGWLIREFFSVWLDLGDAKPPDPPKPRPARQVRRRGD